MEPPAGAWPCLCSPRKECLQWDEPAVAGIALLYTAWPQLEIRLYVTRELTLFFSMARQRLLCAVFWRVSWKDCCRWAALRGEHSPAVMWRDLGTQLLTQLHNRHNKLVLHQPLMIYPSAFPGKQCSALWRATATCGVSRARLELCPPCTGCGYGGEWMLNPFLNPFLHSHGCPESQFGPFKKTAALLSGNFCISKIIFQFL